MTNHIRLLAIGTRGDVQPYVALGLGLQRAGHDVSIGTTADFKTFVESYGLKAIVASQDIHALVTRAAKGGRAAQRRARWEFLRVLMDVTLELAQGADTLVYAPAAVFTAPHVAEKLGIPAIPTMLQPFLTPTRDFPAVGMPYLTLGGRYNRFTYAFVEWLTGTFTKGRVDRWRRDAMGLPPYPHTNLFRAIRESGVPQLYGFSPSVLPKPAEWGNTVHVTGYWFLPDNTAWQPPARLVDFLNAGPAPVYIGFGSMASVDPQGTTEIVLGAIRQSGVRAVIASGWSGLAASAMPESVLMIESAPHEWLFPRVAAAVHHGGAGTTGASLRAGVPTLIIPSKAQSDQPFWGKRVALLGAGPEPIMRQALTADKLAHAIKVAVDDPRIRARAAELGRQIRAENGVEKAVSILGARAITKSLDNPRERHPSTSSG